MNKSSKKLLDDDFIETLFESSYMIIFKLDRDLNLQNANFTAEKMLNFSESTLTGMPFADLCQRQGVECPLENNEHPVILKKSTYLPQFSTLLLWKIWFMNNEGETPYYMLMAEPSLSSTPKQNRHPLTIPKDTLDIDSSVFLPQLIGVIPGSVYWKDLSGRYLGCNQTFASMAGFANRALIVGKTDIMLWPEEQAKRLMQTDVRVLEERTTVTLEEEGYLANGTYRVYLSIKTPLYYSEDMLIGIVGTSLDITQIKSLQEELHTQKEKAETSNNTKTEFLANITHDLKTPLNTIFGFVDLLKHRELPREKTIECVTTIGEAAEFLLSLVDSVLEMARIETHQIALHHEALDLATFIQDIILLSQGAIKGKDIHLLTHYDDDAPRFIMSDTYRLKRILLNLFNNAIKFTEKGHVVISVHLIEKHKQQALIQINIEDTGIGISAQHIPHIFERANRGKMSHNGLYPGSGLGLYIVRKLVEDLQGRITLYSQEGKGSTFSITLPVKLQRKSLYTSKWSKELRKLNILVIEDSENTGLYLQKQLGENRVTLLPSTNVQHALERINKHIDVILIDDQMYHIAPEKLSEWVKEQPQFKKTLLIGLMSLSQLRDAQKNLGLYFQKIIVKPVNITQFLQELDGQWKEWSLLHDDYETILRRLNPSVLVVEDDPSSARIAKLLLEHAGCSVIEAATGKEALIKLNQPIDFAFFDLNLPDMRGIDIISKAKEILPPQVPIVILSAHFSKEDKLSCMAKGADATLEKPLSYESLRNILVDFLTVSTGRK